MLHGQLLPGALHLSQHRWRRAGCRGAAGCRDEARATAAELSAKDPGSCQVPALGADRAPGASKEEFQAPSTA